MLKKFDVVKSDNSNIDLDSFIDKTVAITYDNKLTPVVCGVVTDTDDNHIFVEYPTKFAKILDNKKAYLQTSLDITNDKYDSDIPHKTYFNCVLLK